MNKNQVKIVVSLMLLLPFAAQSAGVAAWAMYTKFKEEMYVGDIQKINAKTVDINNGDNIIELKEKEAGKWILTALRPGKASITIHKSVSGSSHKLRRCHHNMTVYAQQDNHTPGKKRNRMTDNMNSMMMEENSTTDNMDATMAEEDTAMEAQVRGMERRQERRHLEKCTERKCKAKKQKTDNKENKNCSNKCKSCKKQHKKSSCNNNTMNNMNNNNNMVY